MAANFYYLLLNRATDKYVIWEADPQAIVDLTEHSPRFQLIMGYTSKAEAEAERQRRAEQLAKAKASSSAR